MPKYKLPVRLVLSENTEKNEELFIDKPLQADFNHTNCTKIKQGGYVLLDFGCEIRGGVAITAQLSSTESGNTKCRIVFGESVMEALSTVGEKNALNAHAVRDMVVEIPMMSTGYWGSTGFRFVKIEAIDGDIDIKVIKAKLEIKDVEYKGSFECDDELLNEIWNVGAYTVKLNMGEYLWDGVKRDRLVWIGDIHPEASTVMTVFGYDECVPNSLDFVKNSTAPDVWMNGIPTYSMWWIINHYDWYMHNGDEEYLSEQLEYIEKLIRHFANWIDGGYPLNNDFETFVDWSSRDTEGEKEGLKSVLCMGFDCAAKIFDVFKMKEMFDFCINYRDLLKNDVSDVRLNKAVAGLNILTDRNVELSKKVIEGNSSEGMTCFMGYYILMAKAKMGDIDDAVDIIREYWGGMLKMGATTFWEDFDVNWMQNSCRIDEVAKAGMNDIHGDFGRYCYQQFRHSLCHGWASGPTSFLTRYILGVEVLEAGCKKVQINPHLGNLKWVKGKYPTPYGIIEIEHKNIDGKTVTSYTAPDSVEVILK